MKISRLRKEHKEYFLGMDPLMKMERLSFPNAFAFAATVENEKTKTDIPAGMMICTLQEKEIFIEWLYVDPAFRMQGIGEALLVNAFDIAEKANLQAVCACFDGQYGRDFICHQEEIYFKQRMFETERMLPGEWLTDLRTLVAQPYFAKISENLKQVIPLKKIPRSSVLKSIFALAEMAGSASVYPVEEMRRFFDEDLSVLKIKDKKICGGLLIQCVENDESDVHDKKTIKWKRHVLYPILLCAESEEDTKELLYFALQAAVKKYGKDADVHVIAKNQAQRELMEQILPGEGFESKLLLAEIASYTRHKMLQENYGETLKNAFPVLK